MSTFDQAQSYEENSSAQMSIGVDLIQMLSPRQGWNVLDIGCGTGGLTKILADSVGPQGSVVGIDPDTDRLKIARENHSADNITYVEGVAEDLPVCNYDLIFSNLVLQWLKDKEVVFQQASSVLKKGKLLAFTCLVEHDREKRTFPQIQHCVSDEFKKAFLGQFYYLQDQELDHYSSKYDFIIKHFNQAELSLAFNNVDHLIQIYRTQGVGKNFSLDHFNIAAIKQVYKGSSARTFPVAVVILQKQ